ncbi:MAG: glycerate kinase [Candidatus Caldarchaeum sp.]
MAVRVCGGRGLGREVAAVVAGLEKGLAAVNPEKLVRKHVKTRAGKLYVDGKEVDLKRYEDFVVLAVGKAAAPMASALLSILEELPVRGVVSVPRGTNVKHSLKPLELFYAGHPTPDEKSMKAAEKMLKHVEDCGRRSLAFALISGGCSSLASLPAEGVTLEDKIEVTSALLRAGASIEELNTVRKHLSAFKGGWLAKKTSCPIISLILSDVVGDRVDVIGSGPTAPDPTTYREALEILRNRRVHVSENVWRRLEKGAAGLYPETPKPGDPCFRHVKNIVVGGNFDAVKAAARKMEQQGYRTITLTSRMTGEAREAARFLSAIAMDIAYRGIPLKPPAAVVVGGETTVTVKGSGSGGRNQELVLAASIYLKGLERVVFASLGTDGVDGPTDAAGAVCTGRTYRKALAIGLKPEAFLANNDSHSFFSKVGGLLKTGPTATNVGDIAILCVSRR